MRQKFEKFETLKCLLYFTNAMNAQFRDRYPSNATALVADGAIQVLHVQECRDFDSIKMKVEGIEGNVWLNYSLEHGDISLEIGKLRIYWHDACWYDADDPEAEKVLNALHEALRIPKHQIES